MFKEGGLLHLNGTFFAMNKCKTVDCDMFTKKKPGLITQSDSTCMMSKHYG